MLVSWTIMIPSFQTPSWSCLTYTDHISATHINAWTRYDEPLNCADPDAGEYIKKQTTEKLQREAKENNWDPLSEGFGKVVYAVCRVFEVDFDGVMVETGGWYAAEAVREFLKTQADVVARNASWSHALRAHAAAIRKQAEEFVVMTDYQGFVVHNNSRKLVATFRANHNDVFYRRSPLDLGRYRPVTILSLDICKWSI